MSEPTPGACGHVTLSFVSRYAIMAASTIGGTFGRAQPMAISRFAPLEGLRTIRSIGMEVVAIAFAAACASVCNHV